MTETKKQDLDIGLLDPHPLNSKIYQIENIEDLARDIKSSQWVKPLVVTPEADRYLIVSGHRRHAAASLLGLDVIPCEIEYFDEDWQVLERLLMENQYREKDTYTKTKEYPYKKQVEAARARLRMLAAQNNNAVVENFPQQDNGKSRDKAAQEVGLGSGKTAEKAVRVVQKADSLREQGEHGKADLLVAAINKSVSGAEKLIPFINDLTDSDAESYNSNIASGEISVGRAIQEVKREQQKQKQEEIRLSKKSMPLPDGKYDVIYCDPPWRYDFAETENRAIESHYPTMDIEDIKSLFVPAADNCVLFMWATAPKLKEAFDVISAWGFEYKTQAVWNKEKIGMGYWFRGQHEILMVATKGNVSPPPPCDRHGSVYSESRSKHSKKPSYYYDLIKQMFPNARRIELFSRCNVDGFEHWGNE
jgi:N6-adenosine-specific RNA methylase IME4